MTNNILIGPGGTAGLGYEEGLKKISELGLDALECELTHGINISNATAKMVGELAKKLNISLSVHAPYFLIWLQMKKLK